MITAINQYVPLNNGRKMPGYGFGLYKSEGDELIKAVHAAWECGYRLYDTAVYYHNEEETGRALAKYPRRESYLISKIWPTDFNNAVKTLHDSLKRLNQDYLDACLLHWPGTDESAMLKAWEELSKEREKGRILTLGVSNFLISHLEKLHEKFGQWAPINQVEIHPRFQQKELCAFCADKNMEVMAWSPLGRGDELSDEVIDAIARETGKSPAQVILRWHVQQNRIPLPKSVHAERIRANADVFSFSLSQAQMERIDGLDLGLAGRRGADPVTFAG